MNQSTPAAKAQFESSTAFPICTVAILMGLMYVYYLSSTTANDRFFEMTGHGFRADDAVIAASSGQWGKVANMLYANFASLHYVQLFFSAYFVWVFGVHTESKMGAGRLMFVVLLGATLPWLATAFLHSNKGDDTIFVGPLFILCSLLGAYMVIPPEKQKIRSWMPKNRQQIFNIEEKKDITEHYMQNPMIYVAVFAVVQIAFHFACTMIYPGYDTLDIAGAAIAYGIGYGIAYMLLASATGNVQDAPMKLGVLQHYRKLIEIDVPHEQALMGTSKALGLPYEQVRDWVNKDKGKMKISRL
jgi:membrane associated rhomboid family serine protease